MFFFIIVTKETKSKTVYEEVEDLKLNNVVSGDFLRTQPSHGDFFLVGVNHNKELGQLQSYSAPFFCFRFFPKVQIITRPL